METKDLMYKRAYVWDKLNAEERKACMDMGEDYKAFLNESKTERRWRSARDNPPRQGSRIRMHMRKEGAQGRRQGILQ